MMINITHNVRAYCLKIFFLKLKYKHLLSVRESLKKLQFDHNRSLLKFFEMFKFAAIFGTPFILVSLGSKGADVNILCENKQSKVYKSFGICITTIIFFI